VNTTSALSRRVIAIEISISIRYHSGCGTQRRWPGIARNICAVSLRKGSERRLVYHSPVRRGAGRLTTETADTILGAKPPRGRDHGRFDCATSRGPVDQDLDFAWPPLAFEARKRVARSFRCLGARSQHGRCVLPPLRVVVQGARISRSRPWVLSHSVPDGRRSLQDPSAHFPERVSGHFEATDSALSVDARGPGMVCPRTQSGQKWQPGGPGGRSERGRATQSQSRESRRQSLLAARGFDRIDEFLRAEYAQGASLADLARSTRLGRAQLSAAMSAAGIIVRPPGSNTPAGKRSRARRSELVAAQRIGTDDLHRWLREHRASGWTLQQLAEAVGHSAPWVRWRLDHHVDNRASVSEQPEQRVEESAQTGSTS
jgi:hypothetical protein